MTRLRTIVIGDVHGCSAELEDLLRLLDVKASDRLVFLGDLVDRGPDSAGVVQRVRALGAECVIGNHDDKHVRWAKHERKRRERPGSRNPMKSMSPVEQVEHDLLRPDDIAFLEGLPATIALGHGWLAVHAGLEPGREEQKRGALCRVRWVDEEGRMKTARDPREQPEGSVRWSELWRGPEHVVYGHHVLSLKDPVVDRNDGIECWGIDTGCCFGGRLTALCLPEKRVYQVDARQAYVTY